VKPRAEALREGPVRASSSPSLSPVPLFGRTVTNVPAASLVESRDHHDGVVNDEMPSDDDVGVEPASVLPSGRLRADDRAVKICRAAKVSEVPLMGCASCTARFHRQDFDTMNGLSSDWPRTFAA
jgi:hypothetical protein